MVPASQAVASAQGRQRETMSADDHGVHVRQCHGQEVVCCLHFLRIKFTENHTLHFRTGFGYAGARGYSPNSIVPPVAKSGKT